MIRKRGGWLAVLFLGEMLTATAMGHFEGEIARAVVLALFVPLIISSGGNSGSQASTLVIRAMALGEVRLRDWWRVVRRELRRRGSRLGSVLAAHRLDARPGLGRRRSDTYGAHYAAARDHAWRSPCVGVVLWGTLVRLDAAVPAPPPGLRPGERLGAVRRDARRRHRPRHLLQHGADRHARAWTLVRVAEATPQAILRAAPRGPSFPPSSSPCATTGRAPSSRTSSPASPSASWRCRWPWRSRSPRACAPESGLYCAVVAGFLVSALGGSRTADRRARPARSSSSSRGSSRSTAIDGPVHVHAHGGRDADRAGAHRARHGGEVHSPPGRRGLHQRHRGPDRHARRSRTSSA